MMKRYLLILLTCIVPLTLFSRSLTEEEIIEAISRSSAAMQYLECGFVQTRTLKILDDKMVSKGKMYYAKPERLKWEYTSPYSSAFILDGDKAIVTGNGKNDVMDVRKSRNFRKLAGLITDSLTGKAVTDSQAFSTSAEASGDMWTVTLIPLRSEMKHMWKSLVMHFDYKKDSVVRIEINEKSGDTTVIEFIDIIRNKPVDNGIFNISQDL